MARRVERSLLSYERSGWLEDTTTVTKHTEIRPSAEMGPIICCLDTSGSMHGARETVAKVSALYNAGPYRQCQPRTCLTKHSLCSLRFDCLDGAVLSQDGSGPY